MSRQEAVEQYSKALKAGQKYYKNAVSRGAYPYPTVLDELINEADMAGYAELGLVNIPADRIVGTRTAGRVAALAGSFMPLLPPDSEFGGKWIHLCQAHLSEEGIHDPVRCYEYMGRFYVQEGNKRVSVLLSYQAPSIPALVTRVIPPYSEDNAVQVYYEFMRFYALSGLYGPEFTRRGGYGRLQAALGFEPEHVWTESERRSFTAGYTRFCDAFEKLREDTDAPTPAEALLVWLQVFSFSDLKNQTPQELKENLSGIWPDILAQAAAEPIAVSTEPEDKNKGLISRLLGTGHSDHINVAFLYAYDPETSAWTQAHDHGRQYLEERLGERVTVKVYHAYNHDYFGAIETAIEEGAELIFATTPSMIAACRKAAALHSQVKILNCALSQPYTGVRMYYSRIHECKFITGAIAGAMAREDRIGYVANYPIFGSIASINAFALGVRLTNPRARVALKWSCLPERPVPALIESGVTVISNREAVSPGQAVGRIEYGTYRLQEDGELLPLAVPCWNWGKLYERIVLSVFSGAWANISGSKAINYWWGLASGVLDVQFGPSLPDGLKSLGDILKRGIIGGSVDPFRSRILDQNGVLRSDGSRSFSPEELMQMDWLCEHVDGEIPAFDKLLPMSHDLVRVLGIYRDTLPPEKEEKQL